MAQSASYQQAAALHASSQPFSPAIPVNTLPYLAFVLLLASFFGAFFFTTLHKRSVVPEVLVAVFSSLCAGFGVVALFNSVGVYV